jgi:hypothetical protein
MAFEGELCMMLVRRFAGVIVAACVLSASGFVQVDSKSLRAEFGKPTRIPHKEVFAAAAHVQLTVSYDPVGQACVLVFLPDHLTKYRDRTQMTSELEAMAQRAIPDKLRGKNLNQVIETINGCAGRRLTRYEQVDVTETIFSNVNSSCETQMQVEVRFRRNICASPQ